MSDGAKGETCLHCQLAEALMTIARQRPDGRLSPLETMRALTNLLFDVIETARTPAERRALTRKIAADMVAYGEKSPTVLPEGRPVH